MLLIEIVIETTRHRLLSPVAGAQSAHGRGAVIAALFWWAVAWALCTWVAAPLDLVHPVALTVCRVVMA